MQYFSTDVANVASADATLDRDARMQLKRGHCVVSGLQWGDEGKGQIVDLLTRDFDIVARYNGGNNAGHSVHIGDEKFALHLVPSGILYPKKLNLICNGVVVDPSGLLEEMDGLRKRGIAVGENLRISNRAHVVLPYHKVQDALFDSALAQAWEGPPIGTTGRGIGPCYADKALRSTAIRMTDLLNLSELKHKLVRIVAVKNAMLEALAKACGQTFETIDSAKIYDACCQHAEQLQPHICDTSQLLNTSHDAGKRVLFEGANAALLDIDHGTYPFVTSSSCSSLGVYSGAGVPGNQVENVIGIIKLYTSRVGGGPFPTELQNDIGDHLRETGREYGTTTGRPRRCGWLDLMAVKYTATFNGVTGIACTGLSVLRGLERLSVCVGYRHMGRGLDCFPADAGVLSRVEPIYEQFEGFSGSADMYTTYEDLPSSARHYLQFIEDFLRVPIRAVCVGPRRDQIIIKDA